MENTGRQLVCIRPRGGEADQKSRGKEPAGCHSITSSTRARIEGLLRFHLRLLLLKTANKRKRPKAPRRQGYSSFHPLGVREKVLATHERRIPRVSSPSASRSAGHYNRAGVAACGYKAARPTTGGNGEGPLTTHCCQFAHDPGWTAVDPGCVKTRKLSENVASEAKFFASPSL